MPHFCDPFVCCSCLYDEEEKVGHEINRKITREMAKSKHVARNEIKMLLLGTGEAGKSTVMKQMRIIHGKEYEDDTSRLAFVQSVRENVVESIQILLRNLEKLSLTLSNPENEKNRRKVMGQASKPYSSSGMADLFAAIAALWEDDGVRECYHRRADFKYVYLSDSSKYFLDRLDAITDPMYVPTEQDILRVRKSSTGVQEYSFDIKHISFRVVDVGGQRSERRKWIHCFENVTALIFVASLSDYDQCLLDKTAHDDENKTVNRMEESLALFSVVIAERFLQTASIILFLNKTDIFGEKIQERDLATYFPEYADYRMHDQSEAGPTKDSKTARQFVLSKYMEISKRHAARKAAETGVERLKSQNSANGQMLYSHFTCATDTENMKFVTKAVEDLLLKEALVSYNLV